MSRSPEEPSAGQRVPLFLRIVFIASLALFLLASGGEFLRWQSAPTPGCSHGPGPGDSEIVPGIRIGFITLQLSIKEVEKRLGNAHIEPTEKAAIYRFPSPEIKCVVENGKVTSVLTLSPDFHTRQGLKIGSAAEDVVRNFGDRYEYEAKDGKSQANPTYVLHYWQQGIHFSIDHGTVRLIWVTEMLDSSPN